MDEIQTVRGTRRPDDRETKQVRAPEMIPVDLPYGTHEQLKYLSRVDGLSVPKVIRTMVDNGLRARRATDSEFREFARRY